MTFAEKLEKQVESLTEERVRAEYKKKLAEERQKSQGWKKESALMMLKDKFPPKDIARYLYLSVDEVLELQKTL